MPKKPALPQLRIEYWPVERLKPYERNPRKNDHALEQIRASIREFGFTVPVLAKSSDGEVIDGHLRLKGAIAEKLKEVPVIPCDNWTEAQVKAFRLMVNRSVNWAEWDSEALKLEFGELKAMEFDLSLTGFDSREVDAFTLAGNPAEDDVPPVPDEPVSKPGDVWLMGGSHILLCGDATNPEDVRRVLNGTKPLLMVTDPPYGVEYNPDWRPASGAINNNTWQKKSEGKLTGDNRVDWREAWSLFPGSVVYLWHAGTKAAEAAGSLTICGFQIRAQVIWAKRLLVIGRGHYHIQHEPCWYAVKGTGHWQGDRKQTTLWMADSVHATHGNVDDGKTIHSTQKPVEIMRRPILNHTVAGDSVYDPFLGSGTTLVAAELTDRFCYGLEIDPAYCDVIVTRWQNLTSKAATLEGDGRTFAAVKAERLASVAA